MMGVQFPPSATSSETPSVRSDAAETGAPDFFDAKAKGFKPREKPPEQAP